MAASAVVPTRPLRENEYSCCHGDADASIVQNIVKPSPRRVTIVSPRSEMELQSKMASPRSFTSPRVRDSPRVSASPRDGVLLSNVSSPKTAKNRKMFTICSESDDENSPRAPNLNLSRLEAGSGLVNLTSHCPGSGSEDTEQSMDSSTSSSNGKGVQTSNNSQNKQLLGDYEFDDDLVLVTDKSSQTDDVSISCIFPSSDPISSTISSSQNDQRETTHEIPERHIQTPEDELIKSPLTGGNSNMTDISEAPTLKVEYVGKVWDSYVNDFLLGCTHIHQAAIYDIATAKCIACSPDFVMSQDDFHHLDDVLTNINRAFKEGVTVNGYLYNVNRADGRRGLMARADNRDGCSACRTRTLVIIALHKGNSSSRICNEHLMDLGDFFWTKGL